VLCALLGQAAGQGVILPLTAMLASAHAASASQGNGTLRAKDGVFNVRAYGAKGDGATLETVAINRAIEACAKAGGGEVLVPPGRYLSGTIHLRSHITLFLAAGGVIVGTTNLNDYQAPHVPAYMPEARWGKWHRGLVVGDGLRDVTIAGGGLIDGNKVFDPTGEEHMRGPHTIAFTNCRGFTIRDISILDAANYAIFFQVSDDVDIWNVKITGGWDGVHFRGAPQRWCRHVNIIGCQFCTGDDSIAGRYWDGVVISGCIINSSCNGLRLIGPAEHLIVNGCLFYGPGLRPHRTSKRTNMLSGIILQPGAWDRTRGPLDDVLIANNTMAKVASPVTIWTKPGNPVGRITIAGLTATGVYRSALSVESWSQKPISKVVVRDANIEFTGGGSTEQARQPVRSPGVDARPLPAWGIYARNVQDLTLEDVRLDIAKADLRPVLMADRVENLTIDNVRFPRVQGVSEPIVTRQVRELKNSARDKGP
jgi:polygalacturonase